MHLTWFSSQKLSSARIELWGSSPDCQLTSSSTVNFNTKTACSNTPTLLYIKGLILFSFQLLIYPLFSLLIPWCPCWQTLSSVSSWLLSFLLVKSCHRVQLSFQTPCVLRSFSRFVSTFPPHYCKRLRTMNCEDSMYLVLSQELLWSKDRSMLILLSLGLCFGGPFFFPNPNPSHILPPVCF